MDMAEGTPGGDHPEFDRQGSKQSPFEAAHDPFADYGASKGLNSDGPETEIVLASGAPGAGEFRGASGAPEANMNNGGTGTSPDGGGASGAGNDPEGDGDVIDGEVKEEDEDGRSGKEKLNEEKETKENNYTWEEFSSRVRTVIEFDRINDNNRQAVDDLEEVGVRIRVIMDSDDNEDLHERNRGLRIALESVLNKIDEKRNLDQVDADFLVGMGVSKDKIDEWTGGAKKNNENDKKNMNSEQKTDAETEEKQKREAHIALERLIAGKNIQDVNVSDGPLFDAWVINHGGRADAADYREAVKWRSAIEAKIQEKIQEEERKRQETARQQKDEEEQLKRQQKDKEEIDKREREAVLTAEKAEREKEKREKQQRAREELAEIIRDRSESDEVFEKVLLNWRTTYGKDASGELKVANRYLEEIYERRAAEKAEKDAILAAEKASKEAVRRAAIEKSETISLLNSRYNKFITELNAKPKLIPSSKEKKEWFDRLAYFISYYDKEYFGHIQEVADKVALARALEKEEKAKELTTGDKVEGLLGDILNPGNLLNKLTGGRLYKRRPYIKK